MYKLLISFIFFYMINLSHFTIEGKNNYSYLFVKNNFIQFDSNNLLYSSIESDKAVKQEEKKNNDSNNLTLKARILKIWPIIVGLSVILAIIEYIFKITRRLTNFFKNWREKKESIKTNKVKKLPSKEIYDENELIGKGVDKKELENLFDIDTDFKEITTLATLISMIDSSKSCRYLNNEKKFELEILHLLRHKDTINYFNGIIVELYQKLEIQDDYQYIVCSGKNEDTNNMFINYFIDHTPRKVQQINFGSLMFNVGDFKDLPSFVIKLRNASDPLLKYIRKQFRGNTQKLLNEYIDYHPLSNFLQEAVVNLFNKILKSKSLYRKKRFMNINLSKETKELIVSKPGGDDLIRLNRLLIEEAYPQEFEKNIENIEYGSGVLIAEVYLDDEIYFLNMLKKLKDDIKVNIVGIISLFKTNDFNSKIIENYIDKVKLYCPITFKLKK